MILESIKKDYESGDSVPVIAERYKLSESKVTRSLKKLGVKMRTRSEAAKIALERGRSVSPTEGKGHSQEARDRMSVKRAEAWEKGGDKAKEQMSNIAKTNWAKKSDFDKANMQSKAGSALRVVASEGSAAEKYLVNKLIAHGYVVEFHNKNIVYGQYEIDIMLPNEGIVIEIDGPHHYLPIYGEERLQKTIAQDETKNGVLITHNLKVVRIKYTAKKFNSTVGRRMWDAFEKVLQTKLEPITYIEF